MDKLSLRETVDLRAVKYLNSMPKAWWKEILKTDKERKFEVEYKKVKSFLSGQLDGTGIIRQYKYADGKTFGRQFGCSHTKGRRASKVTIYCPSKPECSGTKLPITNQSRGATLFVS